MAAEVADLPRVGERVRLGVAPGGEESVPPVGTTDDGPDPRDLVAGKRRIDADALRHDAIESNAGESAVRLIHLDIEPGSPHADGPALGDGLHHDAAHDDRVPSVEEQA